MEEGLKIKIGADVVEAISGLSKVTGVLKQIGASGSANIEQLNKALESLRRAAKSAGGDDLNKINIAIKAIESSIQKFVNVGKAGFDAFGNSIEELKSEILTVTPVVEGVIATIDKVEGKDITINTEVNVASSLANLETLDNKVSSVENTIEDLSGKNVTTTFSVNGVEQSTGKVQAFDNAIEAVKADSNVSVKLAVDAQQAIKSLTLTSTTLSTLGATGEANIAQINLALDELNRAAGKASGAELKNINTAIAGLTASAQELGLTAQNAFGKIGTSALGVADKITVVGNTAEASLGVISSEATGVVDDINSIVPAVDKLNNTLDGISQGVGIDVAFDNTQAVASLTQLDSKLEEVKGSADVLNATDISTKVDIAGIDVANIDIQGLKNNIESIDPAVSVVVDVEATQAIQSLKTTSETLTQIGSTGSANIDQVTIALTELKTAAKTATGTEFANLNTAIAGLEQASINLGTTAKTSFKALSDGADGVVQDVTSIIPAVNQVSDSLDELKDVNLNTTVNVDGSLAELNVLKDKTIEVTDIVEDLSGKNVTTTFNTEGIEPSLADINKLDAGIKQVQADGNVEVLLTVQAQEAINALSITSQELEELGTKGRASIGTVNAALVQLIAAAGKANGVELEGILLTLKSIGEACPQLGINASNAFGLIRDSATESIHTLEGVAPAIDKITGALAAVDGAISITPTVNEQGAVNNLETLVDKALDAKDAVEEIGAAPVTVKVQAEGIIETGEDIDLLDDKLNDLKKNGDFTLDLSVGAKAAISNVSHLDESLERLSTSGKASIRDVQQGLKALADAAKKPGAPIAKINAAMQDLIQYQKQLKNVGKTGFDSLGNAIDSTSKKLTKVRPAADQAGSALQNLGRVATDAPFGFIAISNNLQPLVDSFGSLTKAAGGPIGALKSLGGALIGPAGLGIAFAAVTGAVTFAVQKYGSLGGAIDALFGKVNHLKESQKALLEAQQEANKGAAEELVRLRTLTTIAQDSNRTYEERIKAVKLLRDEFPAYFKDLKDEKILNGDLSSAIAGTTKEILKRARARAAESKLIENQTKVLDNETKRNQLLKDREALQARIGKQTVQLVQGEAKLQESLDSKDARRELGALNEELRKLGEELIPIAKDAQFLQDEIAKVGGPTIDDGKGAGAGDSAAKKAIEQLKAQISAQEELNKAKGRTGSIDTALLNNKIRLIQLEGQEAKLSQDVIDARIKAARLEASSNALNESIASLQKTKDLRGLNAVEQEKLNNLLVKQAALERGAVGSEDQKIANRIAQLQAEIEQYDNLAKSIGLAGFEKQKFTDLKLELFDLKNINTQFKSGEREKLIKDIVDDINTSTTADVAVRIKTEIELIDTPEQVIKKVSDLFPDSGFKIPISIATSVQPLPATIADPTKDKTEEDAIDAKIEKTKKYADVISNELTPVFTNLFDTIGKKGVNAFDVLGDALKQIIKKLLAAVAQALIFQAIMATFGGQGFAGFGGAVFSGAKSILGLQANLGGQNKRFTQGNAANLGRERLVAEVSGSQLNFVLQRNNTSNSRFS